MYIILYLYEKEQEFSTFIPDNGDIEEQDVYLSRNEFADLLRKYHKNSEAIHFLADMMEE